MSFSDTDFSGIRADPMNGSVSGNAELTPLFNDIDDPFALSFANVESPTRINSPLGDESPEIEDLGSRDFTDHTLDLDSGTTVVSETKHCIGLEELPKQIFRKIAREGCSLTLMTAGKSGLGKTTFINTLFEPEEPGSASPVDEIEGKTTQFKIYRSTLRDKDFQLTLTAIDTPGFVDTTNDKFCWVPITNYIDEQFKTRCFQEEQPERSQMTDNRVHVCIYFVTPVTYGLTESDIMAMKNLSVRVNLIPVISKADTFTKDQIMKFKSAARAAMEANEIKICSMVEGEPRNEILAESMPFSIIGSENYARKPSGELVRGRSYNWGIAEVENEQHCDFNRLKTLLMSSNMIDFIEGTEEHYETYRSDLMQYRLQQLAKAEQEEDVDIPEDFVDDLNEGAIEKIRLEEEYRAVDRALKTDNSLEYINQLSTVSMKSIEELYAEQNPIYLENQQKIKKVFATIVSAQEKKFRDWKSALVDKQKAFNKEIQGFHRAVLQLKEVVESLEASMDQTLTPMKEKTPVPAVEP